MYQYPPNVPGVSVGPSQAVGYQADTPAPGSAQTKQGEAAAAPAATETKPISPSVSPSTSSSASPSTATETGFFYKEASQARRARAQMIASGPKPPPLNWKLAIARLSLAVGQLERAIDVAQTSSGGTVAIGAPLAVYPSEGALKQAGRLSAAYHSTQKDTSLTPQPETAQSAQRQSPSSEPKPPNAFALRDAQQTAESELFAEKMQDALRHPHATPGGSGSSSS